MIVLLEEFDFDDEAIINPSDFVEKIEGMPKVAVTCFWGEGFNKLIEQLGGEKIASIGNSNGEFPIYRVIYKDTEIAFYMSDMGSVGAGGNLEEIYAMGVEKVIAYGSCGVLDKRIEDCAIIIPNSAVRDEGMSYHYAPPADEIEVNRKYMFKFTELLDRIGSKYTIGKVWTTDGFYRETRAKMERRKAMGCICVDMECSAMAAVSQFRNKDFFQFFYAEDNLDGEVWDKRSLGTDIRFTDKDKFAILAFELAVLLSEEDVVEEE